MLINQEKSKFTVFVHDHTNRGEFERIQEHVERVIPKSYKFMRHDEPHEVLGGIKMISGC